MSDFKKSGLKSRWATVLLLFCLFQNSAWAQLSIAKHQFFNGISGSAVVARDAFHSPLTYEGFAIGLSMGYTLNTSKFINRWTLDGAYGLLNHAIPASELQFFGGGIDYSFLISVMNKKNFRLYAGLNSNTIWHNRLNNRYSNNSLSFELLSSVGVEGLARYRFKLFKKNFLAEYALTLPVVNYSLRPAYIYLGPRGEFGVQEWSSYGRSMLTQSRLHIDWTFANRNTLRLAYHWLYYEHNGPNRVQLARHLLILGFTTSLEKPPKK